MTSRRVWAARGGTTLAELLVAVALTSLLGAVLCGVLVAQLRVASSLREQVHSADAVRVAAAVLQGEARRITADDVRAASADSLAVRAFRGAGLPCAGLETTTWVRYRGDRLPEPAKDSVAPVGPGLHGRAVALLDARPAAHADCSPAPGERVLQLRLAEEPGAAAVLLVFESGRYYLSSRALRYRLGAEGRQPLTAELLLPGSRFAPSPDRLGIQLETRAGGRTELPAWYAGTRTEELLP